MSTKMHLQVVTVKSDTEDPAVKSLLTEKVSSIAADELSKTLSEKWAALANMDPQAILSPVGRLVSIFQYVHMLSHNLCNLS